MEEKKEEVIEEKEEEVVEESEDQILTRAEEVNNKFTENLKRKEELLNREDRMIQARKIAGNSEAGFIKKEKTDDEKWAESAKERYAGSGQDPTEDNTPTTYS